MKHYKLTDFGIGHQQSKSHGVLNTLPGLEPFLRVVKHRTYSNAVYKDGKRLKSNVLSIPSVLVFDIDEGLSLSQVRESLTESGLSFFLFTTRSHQIPKGDKPACDRMRVIIPISREITTEREYLKLFNFCDHAYFMSKCDKLEWGRFYFPSENLVLYRDDLPDLDVDFVLSEVDGVETSLPLFRSKPEHGVLSRRTREFLTSGRDSRNWHHDFVSACFDLKAQKYSKSEAEELLRGVTGVLDDKHDLVQLNDIFDRRTPYQEYREYNGGGAGIAAGPSPTQNKSKKLRQHDLVDLMFIWSKDVFRIRTLNDDSHYYVIKDLEKKEVEAFQNEDVLIRFFASKIRESRGFVSINGREGEVTPRQMLNVWMEYGELLEDFPEPFLFSDDVGPSWTFQRLGFSESLGAHPAWDSYTNRIDCPLSRSYFMAWVSLLFDKKDHGRLALWKYGPKGQDGKSTVMNTLGRLLGASSKAINNNSLTSGNARFLASSLYNKRLIYYPDCLNSKFVLTEQFRQFTGSDPITVEIKNGGFFDYPMKARVAIASNKLPFISSSNAIQSRVLVVPITQLSEEKRTSDFGEDLFNEFGHFLYSCRQEAKKLVNHNRDDFPIDPRSASHTLMKRSQYESELEWQMFVEKYFVIDESAEIDGEDLFEIVFNDPVASRSAYARENLTTFIEQRYGVAAVNIGPMKYKYRGLRALTPKAHPY